MSGKQREVQFREVQRTGARSWTNKRLPAAEGDHFAARRSWSDFAAGERHTLLVGRGWPHDTVQRQVLLGEPPDDKVSPAYLQRCLLEPAETELCTECGQPLPLQLLSRPGR